MNREGNNLTLETADGKHRIEGAHPDNCVVVDERAIDYERAPIEFLEDDDRTPPSIGTQVEAAAAGAEDIWQHSGASVGEGKLSKVIAGTT